MSEMELSREDVTTAAAEDSDGIMEVAQYITYCTCYESRSRSLGSFPKKE